MRHLHSRSIGILLLVLALAQFCMLGLFAWYNQQKINENTRVHVEQAARSVGESYTNRKIQISALADKLVNHAELQTLVRNADQAGQEQLLTQVAPQGEGEFIAILTSDNQLSASISGVSAKELGEIEQKLLNLDHFGPGFVAFDNRHFVTQTQLSEFRGASHRIVTGFDPQVSLKKRVSANDGVVLTTVLSSVSNPGKSHQHIVGLALDAFENQYLLANLDFSSAYESGSVFNLFKSFAVQTLVVLSLCSLLASVLMSSLLRQTIQIPVNSLRKAIHGLIKGKFEHAIEILDTAPFDNVSHDLEVMREAIFDRESRIMHHAEYDSLTGLTNRSVVSEKLKTAMARAKDNNGTISALAIDLSRFSEINGSLGHEVGDAVLKEIARRLASNARVTDTVARIGGDEFFIILEDGSAEVGQQLAKFMVSSLLRPISVNGNEVKLSVHSGVAFYPQHGDNAEAIRRMANIALYTSKETKSAFTIYEPGQDEKHLRELAIIHDLPNAIKNDQLYLQYQPKIDMETQQVNQVEALVRWRHPQLGFIPPDEFIALLEKAGLIGRLTDWVFKQAIKQIRDWTEGGFDLGIAVNISANDLADDKLAEKLKYLLHHYLVKPSSITVEVTESAVIEDPENSVKLLNELRHAGIKISLDDFGTGQTSLALLKQLPISEIKIDKSFVQNLRADSGDAIIVKSIIDLGHNMGLHVIAEGVESNYCWNLLNSYGCNLVQGYLVSAPLTADELGEWQLRLQDRHVNKLDLSFVHDMTG